MFPTIHGVVGSAPRQAGGGGGGDLSVVASTGVKGLFGFTVDVPEGTMDGDLMLAFVVRRSNSTLPNLASQGWTLIDSDSDAWYYSRVADSEPDAYNIASGSHAAAAIVTLRSASNVDAHDLLASITSGTSYVAPSVTPSQAPGVLVCFWAIVSGTLSADLAPPEGMTTLEVGGDSNIRFALAWEAFSDAEELGTRTATAPSITVQRRGVSVAVV